MKPHRRLGIAAVIGIALLGVRYDGGEETCSPGVSMKSMHAQAAAAAPRTSDRKAETTNVARYADGTIYASGSGIW